jgi:hypothetical protein
MSIHTLLSFGSNQPNPLDHDGIQWQYYALIAHHTISHSAVEEVSTIQNQPASSPIFDTNNSSHLLKATEEAETTTTSNPTQKEESVSQEVFLKDRADELNEEELKIYTFIQNSIKEKHCPPYQTTIAKKFHISNRKVVKLKQKCIKLGLLQKSSHNKRMLEIVPPGKRICRKKTQ